MEGGTILHLLTDKQTQLIALWTKFVERAAQKYVERSFKRMGFEWHNTLLALIFAPASIGVRNLFSLAALWTLLHPLVLSDT